MKNIDIGTDHCRVIPVEEAQKGFEQFEFFRHLYPYSEASLRIQPDALVLEIGCGEGYGAHYLSTHLSHLSAIDLSLKTLTHIHRYYPEIQVFQALGTILPFATESFDSIISFQVIEHIVEVRSYIQEAYRVLKFGGSLYITTPNRKLRLLPFQKPWNTYHTHEYSGNELRNLLRSYFNSVQIHGIMASPYLMSLEKARVKQTLLRIMGRIVKNSLKNRNSALANKVNKVESRHHEMGMSQNMENIELSNFFISQELDPCLDFFVIATKMN